MKCPECKTPNKPYWIGGSAAKHYHCKNCGLHYTNKAKPKEKTDDNQ